MSCEQDTYIIGATLRASGVTSLDGTPTDATSLTAVIFEPDGHTSHSITPTQGDDDGEWTAAYTPSSTDPTGSWKMRITAVLGGDTEIEDVVFTVIS